MDKIYSKNGIKLKFELKQRTSLHQVLLCGHGAHRSERAHIGKIYQYILKDY